jgi:hypothetical protein
MKKIHILVLATTLIFSASCKKNQLGGKSTVKGTVAHHERAIPYAAVFIKFNAKNFPGADTTIYDDKVRADASGNFSFKCYKGDYYLYGFGFDYTIPPPYHVVGGVPVHVRNRETVEADVAVTEE